MFTWPCNLCRDCGFVEKRRSFLNLDKGCVVVMKHISAKIFSRKWSINLN